MCDCQNLNGQQTDNVVCRYLLDYAEVDSGVCKLLEELRQKMKAEDQGERTETVKRKIPDAYCNFDNIFHWDGRGAGRSLLSAAMHTGEIVVPIIIMAYLSTETLTDISELSTLRRLLVANGWTWLIAVNVMLFSLMHWPCSTACLTIRKETGSLKWMLVSFAVPTVIGTACCFVVATAARLFGLV